MQISLLQHNPQKCLKVQGSVGESSAIPIIAQCTVHSKCNSCSEEKLVVAQSTVEGSVVEAVAWIGLGLHPRAKLAGSPALTICPRNLVWKIIKFPTRTKLCLLHRNNILYHSKKLESCPISLSIHICEVSLGRHFTAAVAVVSCPSLIFGFLWWSSVSLVVSHYLVRFPDPPYGDFQVSRGTRLVETWLIHQDAS